MRYGQFQYQQLAEPVTVPAAVAVPEQWLPVLEVPVLPRHSTASTLIVQPNDAVFSGAVLDFWLPQLEVPTLRRHQTRPGLFEYPFDEIIPAPAPAPDYISLAGEQLPIRVDNIARYLPPLAFPLTEAYFPTTLDDLLDILRALAVELQPNAQYEAEKRRNWQKLVEALSRI